MTARNDHRAEVTAASELTPLHDLILRIVQAAGDRGISKKNIIDMVNLILQEAASARTSERQRLVRELREQMPKKQIPYWRSHKGDEIDHARAIGYDEAINEFNALLDMIEGALPDKSEDDEQVSSNKLGWLDIDQKTADEFMDGLNAAHTKQPQPKVNNEQGSDLRTEGDKPPQSDAEAHIDE